VAVQIQQLRRRLHAFADQQIYRNEQGWRIVRSEVEVTAGNCIFDVDGQPFFLTGRIDRIDQHEVSGDWAIWDYKTSDSGYPPERTHRKRNEWVDLQLPLYRYLAAHVDEGTKSILEVDGKIQLGYVQLPKSIADVRFAPAEWTVEELLTADQRAREVVRGLRSQTFGPPRYPPPDFSEDFAGICMDYVFGRPEIDWTT
jgi:ATP-dependent helicase/DNAse subunit B